MSSSRSASALTGDEGPAEPDGDAAPSAAETGSRWYRMPAHRRQYLTNERMRVDETRVGFSRVSACVGASGVGGASCSDMVCCGTAGRNEVLLSSLRIDCVRCWSCAR